MVASALESGTSPNEIAFLAFTKKAATEAKIRASEKFHLDPDKDLIFFRTIHSLALSMTDISKDQIMQEENYRELSDIMGVSVTAKNMVGYDDNVLELSKSSHPILGLINLARLKKQNLREAYNQSHLEEDWNTINYVNNALVDYKKRFNLYDFTDMLELFIKQGDKYCPNFALTFLDEAQDLSPLQWDIAHILDQRSKKMYCAGDDDQAIYRWAGADVDHFINLEGSSETLSQSYRVPKVAWFLAYKVSRRISGRFPKRYKSSDRMGKLVRITTISELNMDEGTWLILAQAGYHLQPVAQDLKSFGYLFNYRGVKSVPEKIVQAVNGWEQLRKGHQISGEIARKIYSFMSVKNRITRGFKKLSGLDDTDFVTLEDLQINHGLLATDQMIWHDAMDKLPEIDRAYIVAMLRRGEKFNKEPRITVSTIHGSKGGEADNVVIFTDLSPAADAEMNINPDDLHRLFYVAVTRTKENLYIVESEDVTRSYDL